MSSVPSSVPRSAPFFFARGVVLLLLALLGLAPACGGGGSPADPFDQTFPAPPVPTGGGGGGGGGTTTPPPAPPQPPTWDPAAALYGRTAFFGSFPSALVRFSDTVFATDADAIEAAGARILAFDVSGAAPLPSSAFATTTILASALLDSAGNPGNAAVPIGFGYFLNDLHVVDATLAFVLANAGGSDNAPTLSNVIAFNPTTGVILQTVNLALPFSSATPLLDSNAVPVPGSIFTQAGAEALTYIPSGATTGRLFVAMSNLVFAAPSFGATKNPGTIQVLDVSTTSSTPLKFTANGVGSPLVIPTRAYNPVALDFVFAAQPASLPPIRRLLVTCAGTTGLDAAFNLVPFTASAVESYDAGSGTFQGRFDLGLAGLSAVQPALGHDAAGHFVGFYPSSVTGEIYLLRLDGLLQQPIDPSRLAVLRGPLNGLAITAAQAGAPGGNLTGVALAPDGRTLVVTGFGDLFQTPALPGRLFLLGLPADVVAGSGFSANFTPGSTEFASVAGRTLGGVVLVPNPGNRPDVYVNLSGTLDGNFLGNASAALGSLQTHGLIR